VNCGFAPATGNSEEPLWIPPSRRSAAGAGPKNWFADSGAGNFTRAQMSALFQAHPHLLHLRGSAQAAFHERAAAAAAVQFGRRVFVRAVVEVSNYCRENCAYCGMRRENRQLDRFRAGLDLVAGLLIEHRPASVTDVNIQAGEDPTVARQVVLPLVRLLRRETPLGVSVCLGTQDFGVYEELRAAGAGLYIIKFETAVEAHYRRLQAPGSLAERVAHIRHLAARGWRVSSGFIAGLPGQGEREWMASLELARQLPLDGCSVSPFIPGESTPLAGEPVGDIDLTLNCMAALRLMRPDWIIPAVSALNLAEPAGGYRRGLRTGANLVTINLTPSGLREDYLLYKRDRFIMTEERILTAIAAEGLTVSRQTLAEHFRQREAPAPAGRAPVLETAPA
jgi:biotin synthase